MGYLNRIHFQIINRGEPADASALPPGVLTTPAQPRSCEDFSGNDSISPSFVPSPLHQEVRGEGPTVLQVDSHSTQVHHITLLSWNLAGILRTKLQDPEWGGLYRSLGHLFISGDMVSKPHLQFRLYHLTQ